MAIQRFLAVSGFQSFKYYYNFPSCHKMTKLRSEEVDGTGFPDGDMNSWTMNYAKKRPSKTGGLRVGNPLMFNNNMFKNRFLMFLFLN